MRARGRGMIPKQCMGGGGRPSAEFHPYQRSSRIRWRTRRRERGGGGLDIDIEKTAIKSKIGSRRLQEEDFTGNLTQNL